MADILDPLWLEVNLRFLTHRSNIVSLSLFLTYRSWNWASFPRRKCHARSVGIRCHMVQIRRCHQRHPKICMPGPSTGEYANCVNVCVRVCVCVWACPWSIRYCTCLTVLTLDLTAAQRKFKCHNFNWPRLCPASAPPRLPNDMTI